MIRTRDVMEQLRKVIDPELGVNIVDLGLIYKVECQMLNAKCQIKILMTLTTPGCPLAVVFEQLVKSGLKGLEGIDVKKDVTIELTFDPPWTPELMKDEVRAELGLD